MEWEMENTTKKIIAEFAETIEMFGLTPLEARLFAYLYLTEKTMTLDEMSEALGKSKTSMSTSIRSLAEHNLVSRVWIKGVRKDLYQANDQLYKLFTSSYKNKWLEAVEHRQLALTEIKEQIYRSNTFKNSPELPVINKKLDEIITFHQQVDQFFRK
ncbi:helix-turn-helix domain-containing protein [Virgibacillus sp. 179-BFC.A HS]|uniref:HTH-type transcriptional regulator n=1 Tax=Tigheibacillus jepli TaxID=3035914 RepID=A0ABU5CIS1_9BACI|nr:helix-turn-helix domain-containing protein [Virgibacillus sp. 179-BFC.A HS]MDY0406243.1 helix-turn-helix domain-containing protein [Virgibacillus sp. 179-BFC.A HS]